MLGNKVTTIHVVRVGGARKQKFKLKHNIVANQNTVYYFYQIMIKYKTTTTLSFIRN